MCINGWNDRWSEKEGGWKWQQVRVKPENLWELG